MKRITSVILLSALTSGCVSIGTTSDSYIQDPLDISVSISSKEDSSPIPGINIEIRRFFSAGACFMCMGTMIPVVVGKTNMEGTFQYSTHLAGNYDVVLYEEHEGIRKPIGFKAVGNLEKDIDLEFTY